MATLSSSADTLYGAMIAGITSDPPWETFVVELRSLFAASHANVIFRERTSSQIFFAMSSIPEVERFGDLTARYDASTDPIAYFEMEAFRAYAIGDFVRNGEANNHPFIRDFLEPLGMGRLLICRVKSLAGLQAWLSVTRAGGRGFTARDYQMLERIARHFAPALDAFGRLKEAEEERDAYARVVHARAAAVARLDRSGAVLHVDAVARQWLDQGEVISLSAGRLRAVDTDDDKRLGKAIARILSGASDEEFLVLGAGDGESLEILLFGVNDRFEPAWTQAPRAIAYMCMNGREALPSPQRLGDKFGLTKREAALAILLARGLTLGKAAAHLGISEQTGRAYLRQIFLKAGVSRQTDLVRQLFGSIASVA